MDPFVRDTNIFAFPWEILDHLGLIGFKTIDQIKRPKWSVLKGGYWLNARDVDLTSEWDLKWLYIDALKEERVKMKAEEDKLAWPEKKKKG